MLAPKSDPARRCRPVKEWPEVDQRAWQAAIIDEDPLECGGAASGRAQLTRKGAVKAYGRWLIWLESAGVLAPTPLPAGQIMPELVREFVVALGTVNAPMTVVHQVESLARVAHALAPDRDWKWLWLIAGRLKHRAISARHARLVGAQQRRNPARAGKRRPGYRHHPRPARDAEPGAQQRRREGQLHGGAPGRSQIGQQAPAQPGRPRRLAVRALCRRRGARAACADDAGIPGRRISAEGAAVQDEIVAVARAGGLRLLGPNCLGLFHAPSNIMGTFSLGARRRHRRGR